MLKDIELRLLAVTDAQDQLVSQTLQYRKKLSSQGPNGRYHESWDEWQEVPTEVMSTASQDTIEEDDDEDE